MNANFYRRFYSFLHLLSTQRPMAAAEITGSAQHPNIRGTVEFYPVRGGVLIQAEISGLPVKEAGPPFSETTCGKNHPAGIFALHIHEGDTCKTFPPSPAPSATDPFPETKGHYNPNECPHPYHAGDLPPLFSTKDGYAYLTTLTDRFTLREIVRKTIIVHSMPDDFTTQPSGNSGLKIACGEIQRY